MIRHPGVRLLSVFCYKRNVLLSAAQNLLRTHGAETVLVACSGGVDSIVLAEVAIDYLGVDHVILGHVDHAIRADSSADAAWVEKWALNAGVRFLCTRLEPGPSDEARLRTARYAALRAQKTESGAQFILTAHHQDDQAETVLMNLIRGTHWPSLAGIAEARDDVLRPLLGISKQEILDFAGARSLRWREDASNREPHYLRNRIRKELLPLMETRYRSGFRGRLARLAGDIRTVIDPNNEYPGIPDISARTAQRQKPQKSENKPHISEVVPSVMPSVEIQKVAWTGGEVPTTSDRAFFDSAVVSRLWVRRHRPGDSILPFGMVGHKKLQDVLVDAKIPRDLRAWLVVVVDEADRVLWVPGVLRSAIAPVNSRTSEIWMCRTTGQQSCSQTTDD